MLTAPTAERHEHSSIIGSRRAKGSMADARRTWTSRRMVFVVAPPCAAEEIARVVSHHHREARTI